MVKYSKSFLVLWLSLFLLSSLPLKGQRSVSVSGIVIDSVSGETIPGVALKFNEHQGTFTRSDGYFTMSLAPGDYLLVCSFVGYETFSKQIKLSSDEYLTIPLVAGIDLEGAYVRDESGSDIDKTAMGVLTLTPAMINSAPAVLGEPDILKTIQLFPGIQKGMEGFSGLYIRGGGPDENLFLLDGVPVYNVSHLLGIFSSFAPEAIKSVEVYKEAFPARYGGRLSGVIDIVSNDGAHDGIHGSGSLGLLTSRAHIEGPIGNSGTTFSLSGRVLNTMPVSPFQRQFDFKYWYQFYDLNAKISRLFGNGDRLSISAYNGYDSFFYYGDETFNDTFTAITADKVESRWGNSVASASWTHRFNGRLSSVLSASFNQYRMVSSNKEEGRNKEGDKWETYAVYKSAMRDYRVGYDMIFEPSSNHYVQFGSSLIMHTCVPETGHGKVGTAIDNSVVETGGKELEGIEQSVFFEDDIRFGNYSLNPGLRYTIMMTGGKMYHSLEPRFSAKVQLNDRVSVKASYSRMSQYMHLLSTSTLALPSDIWVPITSDIPPMFSNQYAVGAYYKRKNGIEISLESYYKSMDNVLEYMDGVTFYGNPAGWEYLVQTGKGRSYGFEVLMRKKHGNLTGWLGYTLSKTERRFSSMDVSGGKWFPYKYDRRHNLVLSSRYDAGHGWAFSALWSFSSGNRMSLQERLVMGYATGSLIKPVPMILSTVPIRNNYLLPPVHHLDVSADWSFSSPHVEHLVSFGAYNVYNAMNPNIIFVTTSEDRNSQEVFQMGTKITFLPVLPYVSYTISF